MHTIKEYSRSSEPKKTQYMDLLKMRRKSNEYVHRHRTYIYIYYLILLRLVYPSFSHSSFIVRVANVPSPATAAL